MAPPSDLTPGRPHAPRRRVRTALAALVTLGVLTACGGGPDGLEGLLQSSRQGKDPQPRTGGWVASLSEDQARDFWTRAAMDPPAPPQAPFLRGPVRHEDVNEVGGTLTAVDEKGRFALTESGSRVLCVIDQTPQVDRLVGCAVLTLPQKGRVTLTVGADGLAVSTSKD